MFAQQIGARTVAKATPFVLVGDFERWIAVGVGPQLSFENPPCKSRWNVLY